MKLTPAERQHIKRERYRIMLDDVDWAHEAYVAEQQLFEMSPHMRDRFMPPTWHYDMAAQIFRNADHPLNEDWMARKRAAELLRSPGADQ